MERRENIQKFFKEYRNICKKYNVSLGHEDEYGGFILYEYDEEMIDWVEAADDNVERKKEEERRLIEQELRFKDWYGTIQQMLSEGLNIVETQKGYVNYNVDKEFNWVPSVYNVLDNKGNEVRKATTSEIGMVNFVARYIRGHELFYEHHEDGMNINMKEMIEWYEKYKEVI